MTPEQLANQLLHWDSVLSWAGSGVILGRDVMGKGRVILQLGAHK